MNRETADAIKKIGNRYIPDGDMFWDFCVEVTSLIVEPIELLHLRDIKQMVIQLQQSQDSRYSALLTAIATNRLKED